MQTSGARADAGTDAALNARINLALKNGVDYLLAELKKESWGPGDAHPTGRTALVVYALLEVGRSFDDPRLRSNSPELSPAMDYLANRKPETAYDAALHVLVLCQAPTSPELKVAINRDRELLLNLVRPDGSVAPRPVDKTWSTLDIAWTYAALAAIEDSGPDVDPGIWKAATSFLTANQMKDGSWPISSRNGRADGECTAAALATLYLASSRAPVASPAPAALPNSPHIEQAIKKLFADVDPQGSVITSLQFERAASAAGLKFADHVDWYRAAAEKLLEDQRDDGAWPGPAGAFFQGADSEVTANALLYLAHGRAPVIFSKLDYSPPALGPSTATSPRPALWNARPRDLANLTLWLSHELDKSLHWQTLSFSGETPWRGTFDSPILLITGTGDPGFTPENLATLRAFVQAGGLIFSSADGGDAAFTDAIVKKYAPLLADKRYEMRALPPNHDLFDASLYAKIASPPPLLGLSNGVREWWIHSPGDLAAAWQSRRFTNRARGGAGDAFLIPANLLRYATGNGSLRNKLEFSATLPPAGLPVSRTIRLARLDYEGNPDPEPFAWKRLAAIAPQRFHTAIAISLVKPAALDAAKTPVAHITGTSAFSLNESDVAALKKFLDDGGTLLADSAGSSPKFTESFLELVKKLYPDAALTDLPINDPLYNGSLPDSFRLTEIQYRKFALLKSKDLRVKPNIQAVTVNGRHVVLFSPEDITSGLLGTDTWGIRGYAPDSAFALARNMLLYAAEINSAAPSSQP